MLNDSCFIVCSCGFVENARPCEHLYDADMPTHVGSRLVCLRQKELVQPAALEHSGVVVLLVLEDLGYFFMVVEP